MSDLAFDDVEAGMSFARARAALLAEDTANARTPGFVAKDAALVPNQSGEGPPFSAIMADVEARGEVGILEFAMGTAAKNAVTYHALADQERAMLRELRTVAEEARR
jgi:flagellar basal body rod protein FlgB